MGYESSLIQVRETAEYAAWFDGLPDRRARARIDVRIRRLQLGNPGDARPVGEGVSELRIDYGPGYRVYYLQRGCEVVILLAGGDKRTQQRDISRARALARTL
ncbi:MAG: type II toxin-antitoxin system RelE/ParE family toxin [Steroidobacteraceae bacterium]|nr:type II toxin-antitoxin system RelE/ParE family toxin [Steroidobacteraceae bacterium]